MIITRTPFRISFFGGGTDYPCWYRRYGGAVLGATIQKYCWLAVRPPTSFGPRFKVVYSRVEECDSLGDISHPAVRECLRAAGLERDGCEVHHWGDLPARSGMGSSSAFVVGLTHALWLLTKRPFGRYDLHSEAIRIEQDVLNETVGDQDQILTTWGGLTRLRFQPVPAPVLMDTVDKTHAAALEGYLMLFYTGIQRTASDVAASYLRDFERHAEIMEDLGFMPSIAQEYLEEGAYQRFGEMLHRAWGLKKSLGAAVSTPEIDGHYEAARAEGAWGGKILGAGGGGFLLLCVPPERQGWVRQRMLESGLTEVPVRFDYEGSVVITLPVDGENPSVFGRRIA